MQQTLIMNRLPLPKYFDGENWNTVVKPTRKSIPKYLHSDLPKLKHMYLKEKFKQMSHFNCPKLEYFTSMIKSKKRSNSHKHKDKSKLIKQQLTQQLQYALLLADRKSNIVEGLIDKARKTQELYPKRHHASYSQKKPTGKYFGNTVQLVFDNRKKHIISNLSKAKEDPCSPQIQERVDNINLLQIQ